MLVTMDISAAFDCVVHEILLTRLQRCYGISGIVLQWIKSYLEGRSQFVKIQNESLETENLSTGVPQGSCLGPFLYCMYVSTLASVVPHNVSFHQYADETIQGARRLFGRCQTMVSEQWIAAQCGKV